MAAAGRGPSAVLVVLILVLGAAPARAGLTGGARLASVYDLILDARFDKVDAALKQACPPAPAEACLALDVVARWWRILLDPDSRAFDAEFERRATASIAASEAWTRREPRRAEAWFYLAGSYAPLVQWRVTRGQRIAAARDGNRIRDALERALALDPTLKDAYFGIGLYHYYADVAPAAAKFLRWLLLLPGGDRVKGLREMMEARDRGEILTGEADYQLHLLYLWYERQPARALELLGDLDRRYPKNPLFLERIAEVEDTYLHDLPASEASWQTLLERARLGHVNFAELAEVSARLGLAHELDARAETDRAIDELKAVVALQPAAPYGALARAELQLGAAYDRLGQRGLAVAAYQAAVAAAPADNPRDIREEARAGLRQAPDPRAAAVYRQSLEGWRALERGAIETSVADLSRAAAAAPGDPVTRYRYARALVAAGDRVRAKRELEALVAARPIAPAFVLASAYVELAQIVEHTGDRARAIACYRIASAIAGGDPDARKEAARSLKRLTATHAPGGVNFDFSSTLCLTSRSFEP